jgi:hypothetical protein
VGLKTAKALGLIVPDTLPTQPLWVIQRPHQADSVGMRIPKLQAPPASRAGLLLKAARHAATRASGWAFGRLFKVHAAPGGMAWMWTLAFLDMMRTAR